MQLVATYSSLFDNFILRLIIHFISHVIVNKKLSYRRDSARCVKRSFKVTEGDIDFIVALNRTLPLSSTVPEISRLVCIERIVALLP